MRKIVLKIVLLLLVFFVFIVVAFWCGKIYEQTHKKKYVYFLTKDIKISSEEGEGILPKGTALYLDKMMPEGFDRYVIYLNMFGKPPLREESAPHFNLTIPLSSNYDYDDLEP